ncbi:MAG: hypothetical protein SGJ13_12350 [Actinomycetota bacterium]|nr:hypothetical protein [Actinomycetota bacterium]
MGTDEARRAAATAMRDLVHIFAAHDPDDEALHAPTEVSSPPPSTTSRDSSSGWWANRH